MKIALLTIWHDGNFGAELQAYATIKILRSLGHEVKMIDIRLLDQVKPNIKLLVGSLFSSWGPARRKLEQFWKENIPTTRRYKSLRQLQTFPPDADVYLVGSDQVWNPGITQSFSLVFFLNFGSPNIKRVSYASSFGIAKWNYPALETEVRQLLQNFNSVSCRESSGVSILKNTFSVDAENVLDPTLLFDNYLELTGEMKETNKLVYYPLHDFPELESYCMELGEKLGVTVENANWNKYLYGNIIWDRNSIEGWIRSIGQAKFVITSSFHGVAMCLIYHRQFAIIVREKKKATRIASLLRLLGIEDRMFDSLQELDAAEPWKKNIDFDPIDARLSNLRLHSIYYLSRALTQ